MVVPRLAEIAPATAGNHLHRYPRLFQCTEIKSSFHRSHSAQTYAKWAATTPRAFRFAVKIPQTITQERALKRARKPLEQFPQEVKGLGTQLVRPSLEFESRTARTFFSLLRELHTDAVVCEARHASWFTSNAIGVLIDHVIGRVAADPENSRGGLRAWRVGGDRPRFSFQSSNHHLLSVAWLAEEVLVRV